MLALDSVENFAAYANGSLNVSGTTTINGDLGLGPNGTQNFLTTPTVSGTYSKSGLDYVSTTITSVSAYAAGLMANQTISYINNGTTITGNGGYTIVNVGSISLSGVGGHKLTLSGGADDIFVLNVSNSVSFLQTSWAPVVLSGGVTADHVLFNLLNASPTANALFVTNGVTLVGTFIAPNASMLLGSVTLDGGVFAGGNDLALNGSTINADIFMLPEPSSFALVVISCLLGLGLWPRRRHHASA
ncbi:MAG TPA: collagen-binding domain-containing protein [Verrucomicrobiae bacterium]|nr:collagen-binding domain-containing protein [Verrucomicrobiae bacterium]